MDLELVSTDELFDELKRRFDGMIFHGVKNKYKDSKEDTFFARWEGGGVLAIGLCEALKKRLLEEYKNQEVE